MERDELVQPDIPWPCRNLLEPPPDLAASRRWDRIRHVITAKAAGARTEADFCRDLSLSLWFELNSPPFLPERGRLQEDPNLTSLRTWLWGRCFELKARSRELRPDQPWPPPPEICRAAYRDAL